MRDIFGQASHTTARPLFNVGRTVLQHVVNVRELRRIGLSSFKGFLVLIFHNPVMVEGERLRAISADVVRNRFHVNEDRTMIRIEEI